MRWSLRGTLAAIIAACLGAHAPAQSGALQESPPEPLRIQFRAENSQGSPVNLTAADIVLVEDGREREVAALEGGPSDPRPTELMLLFDTGMRIAGSYHRRAFKDTKLDDLPVTRIAVYGYENLLMPFSQPTRDARTLSRSLNQTWKFMVENHRVLHGAYRRAGPPPGSAAIAESTYYGKTDSKRDGSTAVYAAIRAAIRAAASWNGEAKRGIVVFGRADPGTRAVNPQEIADLANQLGIILFPVRVWSFLEQMEKTYQVPFLALGPGTGGSASTSDFIDASVIKAILSKSAADLRSSYVAVFQPERSGRETTHRIQIRLRSAGSATVIGGVRTAVY